MGNGAGNRQKRPFTIQEWKGFWKTGRARYTHLDNAIEVAKYGKPQRVLRNGAVEVYRNEAAKKLNEA